jgi:hypothetical protein
MSGTAFSSTPLSRAQPRDRKGRAKTAREAQKHGGTMKRVSPIHAAAVLVAGTLLYVPAASAQAPSPQAEPPQAQAPNTPNQSADIPDKKLDATAVAVQRVANLRQDFQNRLETASPSDRERIADEANSAMAKAVTDQGLSVEEYTAILQMAQADPAVREKIRKRLPASK